MNYKFFFIDLKKIIFLEEKENSGEKGFSPKISPKEFFSPKISPRNFFLPKISPARPPGPFTRGSFRKSTKRNYPKFKNDEV